ncbi:MAG TPA: c-type cytochrome domain-containing protein [Tepidisphaeraceae bacterium]|nr:c-type cytochrome domain-containing protein [Tepidisphaeraceae bacterium]
MKRFVLISAGLLLALSTQAFGEEKIDFSKQIHPIFTQTCYKCHAGAKHKGSLKLDSVENIKKGGKDAKDKVVVPGSPDKSDLFRRIALPKDDDDVMPPDGKGDHLTKQQQDVIKAWISQGADFGSWKEDKAGAAAAEPDKTTDTASADGAPKEIVLPQVAVADAGALDKLRNAGALALPLAQNTNLLSVEFTSNASQVTDEQIALLAPLASQIYDLNLANTKVTDSGLAALEGMKNLHRLHLEKTAITDAGLTHLKNLTALEYLNLYSTAVTDGGMNDLIGLKALKNIYLWQSKVTDSGADTLKKAIPAVTVDLGWKEPAAAAVAPK